MTELKPGDLVTIKDWDELKREVFGKMVTPTFIGKVHSVDLERGVVSVWQEQYGGAWSKIRHLPLSHVVEAKGRKRAALRDAEALTTRRAADAANVVLKDARSSSAARQVATATLAPKVKVYGWQGWRREAPGTHQTREIVAARSARAAALAAGEKDARRLFNLEETGNAEELAVAGAEPGVVFWRGLDDVRGEWRRA